MKSHRVEVLVLISGFLVFVWHPSLLPAWNGPTLPLIQKGLCPFECCQFGRWLTHTPLPVYESEGDTTRKVFDLAVGDTFRAITGNVHMESVGVVIVTKPVESFSPGDTLYTLSYAGEGYIDVWHQGHMKQVEMFWDADDDTDFSNVDPHDPRWKDYSGVLVARPVMVWWVNVFLSDGHTGWLKLANTTIAGFGINEKIEGMDGCK